MNTIKKIKKIYLDGAIKKSDFIKRMYNEHHFKLFEYANFLHETNIKSIEIDDGRVIMTSRDRGIRMLCAEGDYRIAPIEILNFNDYEKFDSRMIENLMPVEGTFYDIGANIGWYSINIAAMQRNINIYCFEPIPKTYDFLRKNIALNSSLNIVAYNYGFSNQAGKFTFYSYPEGSGNASSANLTNRDDLEHIECDLRTLDDDVDQRNIKVDFIKCDVEGAELFVFQGGGETIARDLPIVFSEILRKWSEKFGYDPNEIFQFFRSHGYKAYVAKGDYLTEFLVMDRETVETNFFFLHAEKHRDLISRHAIK